MPSISETLQRDDISTRLRIYLAKQIVESPKGCWVWRGSLIPSDYINICIDYKRQYAHRWVYQQLKGEIPDGLQLDHLCRVRACVNPDHLEPVTAQVNLLRAGSFAAINAKKTCCIRGHELAGDNLIFNPKTNKRNCRECKRASDRITKRQIRASKKVLEGAI